MKSLSLHIKLNLAFLLVAVLMGGASIYALYGAHATQSALLNIIDNDTGRIQNLKQIKFIAVDAEREALKATDGSVAEDGISSTEHLKASQTELQKEIASYRRLQTNQAVRAELDQVTSQASNFMQDAIQTVNATNRNQQKTLLAKLDTEDETLQKLIDQIVSKEENSQTAEDTRTDDLIAHVTFVGRMATGSALILSLLVGILMSTALTRRIARLRESADSIASGNLAADVPTRPRDEIGYLGTSLSNMALRLRDSYGRLSLEKQRDETMLQSMGEGLIALDDAGKVVLFNNVATQLLELQNTAELIGKTLATVMTLYDKDNKPLPPAALPSAVTLINGTKIDDVFIYQSNSKKTLLNITSTPVTVQGQVAGVVLLLRDVTKEKEVDRMKTEFISLASHQLRTPLSAIKWFSEMLVNGDAGDLTTDQKDFAKNISDSTERMIALVNSLLNISRIESGRIIVDPKPTNLKELVDGIVSDLKAKTEERQQSLIVSVHSDLPLINLDPRLIGQVYLNLLTNAIKYSPKNSEISVFISRKGEEIISQVTDNGYGIPKEQQGRIFQKFFRAENVAKHETDGTGLGLYLIKAIVESSGGRIWFESEENKGTTFWFSLPVTGMKAKEGEVTLDA